MKILGINSINYSSQKIDKQNFLKTNNNISNYQFTTHHYQPVNFKGKLKVDKFTLIDKGYEEVKIGENGRVENSSKFLIINTAEQLSAVSKSLDMEDRYFILTSDIQMKDSQYKPIGSYDKPFKGNFDGNGYSIKNLIINSREYDTGLFAFTDGAKISNLKLENINVSATNEAGGLIGHSVNTEINNTSVDGVISGELNIGGLIGVGKSNKINNVQVSGILKPKENLTSNLFFDCNDEHLNSSFGGVIAADEASEINGAYSNVEILANKNCGGIVGVTTNAYCIPTKIKGAWFEGKLQPSETSGAIVGSGINVEILQSIALNNKVIGQNQNCIVEECISSIDDIKRVNIENWDKNIWDLSKGCLPRIKFIKETIHPRKIFLEDINTARELGLFPNSSEKYIPPEFIEIPLEIKPPKHYEKNNSILAEIKASNDRERFLYWFYKYSDYFNCMNTYEHDEILLELVKNKNLDVNHIYEFTDELKYGFRESIYCHPLYVCSRLEKPYIYREMLKRDDIELDKLCGYNGYTDTFNVMQSNPDDASAYVLYSSDNPKVKEYLTKKLNGINHDNNNSSTMLINAMNKHYPKIFKFNEESGMLNIPREYFPELQNMESYIYDSNNNVMNSIDDVFRNMDVSPDYVDSNGNNIINIATLEENELYALGLYKKALVRGTNIENKNFKGETPIDTLLRTGTNQHILADILNKLPNPFVTNELGENAIHIFTKNENEKVGILHIEKAINAGLSVNAADNFGTIPLMNAIEQKYNNMAKFLIQNGADVNICDQSGQSPLHYACINCEGVTDLDLIYTLINRNANTKLKDENGFTPLDYLSDEIKSIINLEPAEYAKFRETLKSTPEIYSSFPPEAIQYEAHTDLLEISNISEENCNLFKGIVTTKLRIPANAILNNLLNGSDVDKTLMQLKCMLNRNEFPDEAISFEYGNTLLHLLMQTNSPFAKECIKVLCQKGNVNINAQNQFKETALMTAIDNYQTLESSKDKLNSIDNIFALLDFSPDVNILDDNNQNVLHRICQSDCVILLSKFLELNTNINQKDSLGKNPIEYLPTDALNKMRKYYENYALSKKLKLNITETLKGVL